jgi:hypothetical protein
MYLYRKSRVVRFPRWTLIFERDHSTVIHVSVRLATKIENHAAVGQWHPSGLQRGSPKTIVGGPAGPKKASLLTAWGDTSWRAAHLASRHTPPGLAHYTKELDSSETEVLQIDCFDVR